MKVKGKHTRVARTSSSGRTRGARVVAFFCLMAVGLGLGPSAALRASQAATGTLSGTVTGVSLEGQSYAIEAARLELDGSASGLSTFAGFSDASGEYKFSAVPPGKYVLRVTVPAYKSVTREVTIQAGMAVTRDVRMELAEVRQEIEVRERAPQISQQSAAPPAIISAPSLKTVPTTQTRFKEALPFIPSVVQTNDKKLYIRGSEETQGMLLTNDLESVDPVTGSFVIDVPVDAIDSLEVFKAPFLTQYGGFSGGMTAIDTKAPSSRWMFSMNDVNPSIRGKAGHWVGFSKAVPRLYFSGPITKKLTFSEAFVYEMVKKPIRGLAWPHDESKTQGYTSLTTFQYMFSPAHLSTVRVNLFPRRQQFANMNALIPQPASSDLGQRGYSVEASDSYQLKSGGLLASRFKFTRVSSYAHGQGSNDMLVTPDGLAGNYFNAWSREARQEEALESYEFPMMEWLGKHSLKTGGELLHRQFDGVSNSRPVLLLREDGTVAERIDFAGAGRLNVEDTEVAAYVQDHWALADRLALDLGVRYLGESLGDSANFAPRLGFVFSPDRGGKTILRGGIGVFDDRVPLLAGDFSNDLQRAVSFLDPQGGLVGSPLTFTNVCAKLTAGQPRLLSSCADLGSNPYNLTWRVEADRHLGSKVQLRLSFLKSRTFNEFVIDPLSSATQPMLVLANTGSARYHEYEASLQYRAGERSDLQVSYVHSRSHGDLNTVNELYVPFQQPVIRPNFVAFLPSDIPDRLIALGKFKLPHDFTIVPAFDLHSGFPYSNVDVFQNYQGTPNSQRYPIYFSVDWRIYRDFALPFGIHKGHKFRLGIYSVNTTGRKNPNAVYNNITSSMFGNFAGLGKRINGIVIGFAE